MKRAKQAFILSTAAAAGLLVASAYAQQPATPPAPAAPAQPPAQSQTQASPAQTQQSQQQQQQTNPASQRGPAGFSAEDRLAFFDARIAAIHAGLKLTADQERLWPPVESAVRDMVRQMAELRQQRRSEAAPTDPIERMARFGEAATKRGQAMTRLADAARPLYASLSDDQKRRLRVLMRAPALAGNGPMMRRRDDREWGHGRRHMDRRDMMDRHEMMGRRGDRDDYDRDGPRYRRDWRDRSDRRDYDREEGGGNDWR